MGTNGNGTIPHVSGRALKIGLSGIIGSYSELATLGWAAENGVTGYEPVYLTEIGPVLEQVASGMIDIGLFPVLNSSVGLIPPALQAMSEHNFVIIGKQPLIVHHCLLSFPGVTADMIKTIASQRPAVDQCERRLHRNWKHVEIDYTSDTATAAMQLAKGELSPTTAVIASKKTAMTYGLDVLQEQFQDDGDNLTTFLVIKRREA